MPSGDVLPGIEIPLSLSPTPLVRLLSLSKIALQHNFVCALLTIAGGVMALHFHTIIQVSNTNFLEVLTTFSLSIQVYSGCPIVACVGPAETGKSTCIRAALSLTGRIMTCRHA